MDVLRPTLSPQQVLIFTKHLGRLSRFNDVHYCFIYFGILRWPVTGATNHLSGNNSPDSLLRSPGLTAWRRAAHTSARSDYRFPQDDSGLPTCFTSSTYVHCSRSIQYNRTASRRATITLATARLPLRTHNRL